MHQHTRSNLLARFPKQAVFSERHFLFWTTS